MQHLQGHRLAVERAGEEYPAGAAARQLPLDRVAVAQRLLDHREEVPPHQLGLHG
jgi:hypothetical protein